MNSVLRTLKRAGGPKTSPNFPLHIADRAVVARRWKADRRPFHEAPEASGERQDAVRKRIGVSAALGVLTHTEGDAGSQDSTRVFGTVRAWSELAGANAGAALGDAEALTEDRTIPLDSGSGVAYTFSVAVH